ncbi:hypothetical protein ACVGOW_13135 [Pseudonocardia saturnea]
MFAASTAGTGSEVRLGRLWLGLSTAAALLAAAGSVVGLAAGDRVYGQETDALADAAAAQDVVGLTIVAPLLVVLGVAASRGSLRAYLGWTGCLAFTVYNFAIYAFSVQFGPLFLVWVAVLGLSVFALVGGLATLPAEAVKARFAARAMPVAAWFVIAVAVLFALLWLSEIVPDLLAGGPSRSATTWEVPTNPVHVLDLALFLPAAVTSGVLLLRRHPFGYATVMGQLVWFALTSLPILVTPFVAASRGHEPGWAVMVPIGVVLVAVLVALATTMRQPARPARRRPRRGQRASPRPPGQRGHVRSLPSSRPSVRAMRSPCDAVRSFLACPRSRPAFRRSGQWAP